MNSCIEFLNVPTPFDVFACKNQLVLTIVDDFGIILFTPQENHHFNTQNVEGPFFLTILDSCPVNYTSN